MSQWAGVKAGWASLPIAGDERWLENEAIDHRNQAGHWPSECRDSRDLWLRNVAAPGYRRTIRTIGRIGSKTRNVICRDSPHAGGSRRAVVLAVSATTRGRGGSGDSEGQPSEEGPNRSGQHEMRNSPPHILARDNLPALGDT